MMHLLFLSLVAFVASPALALELPKEMNICNSHQSAAEINECYRAASETFQVLLDKGIPELGLISLNPFQVKNFEISPKVSGILMKVTDMNLYNAHNYTVPKAVVKNVPYDQKYWVRYPRLYVNGTYHVDGQLLLFNLKGHGPLEIIADDVQATFHCLGEPGRKGSDHFLVKSFEIRFKFNKTRVHLSNLFGGDPVLGQTINQAINQNIDLFIGEVLPLIEKQLALSALPSLTEFFEHFTMDQMFPDIK